MVFLPIVVLAVTCLGASTTSTNLRQPTDSLSLLSSDVHVAAETTNDVRAAGAVTDFLAARSSENSQAAVVLPDIAPNTIAKFYHTSGSWTRYVMDSLVTWLIWVVLMMLIWMTSYPDDLDVAAIFAEPNADPVKTFTSDHFGCFKTPKICLCACFCPALRWADTIDLTGLKKISAALSLFFLGGLFNCFVYGTATYGLFTCLLILYYRHKIRALLGLPNWTGRTCFADCVYVFFCPFCAVAQEARVVRQGVNLTKPAPLTPARVYLPSFKTTAPPAYTLPEPVRPSPSTQYIPPGAPDSYGELPEAVLKRIVH